MSESKQIWVLVEHKNGEILPSTYESLAAANKLAGEGGGDVAALFIGGPGIEEKAGELAARGARRVITAAHESLAVFRPQPYARVAAELAADKKPAALLASGTPDGQDVAVRTAVRTGGGVMTQCTDLAWTDDGRVAGTHQTLGSKGLARCVVASTPGIFTMRPKAFQPLAADESAEADHEAADVADDWVEAGTEFIEFVPQEKERIAVEEADVVVAGGRGTGGEFELIEKLADAIGAGVGASRAVVDAGWYPYASQIGQTGKTVSPRVYIAAGISGAIQHLAGMQSSDIIIAINKNGDAPIFNIANYGIEADLFELLPEVIKLIEQDG